MKGRNDYFSNNLGTQVLPLVMYIDMNCFFASCEQQRHPELRNKPVGVLTYDSPNAAVIAASAEAKDMGVTTGMRLRDAKQLCPQMICVTTHPGWYRQVHVEIMAILRSHCDDVIPKSIDEAVCNFQSYHLVIKDLVPLAKQIKAEIAAKYDYLKCSIGIAPNSYLAKIATILEKRNGLQVITEDNIDEQLGKLSLRKLTGIASGNERRLNLIGIRTPVEMRHSSPALLRKAFGGVVGEYWHKRLNFGEVDMYSRAENRTMSATRTMSSAQTKDPQQIESMLIALCTRLEQRLVKSSLFCKEVFFSIRYRDSTRWDTAIKLADPVQDAMEMRNYIKDKMREFEQSRGVPTLFTDKVINVTVAIQGFVSASYLQYSLFDNRIKRDKLRMVMYQIKEEYDQKNIVRKGAELLKPFVMKDAVGFGSVRDMLADKEGRVKNKHMLEEDREEGKPHVIKIKKKAEAPPSPEEPPFCDVVPGDDAEFFSLATMHQSIREKTANSNRRDFDNWQARALGEPLPASPKGR